MSSKSKITSPLYAFLFICEIFGFPAISVVPVFLGVDSRPISVGYRLTIVSLTLIFVCMAWRERWPFLKGPISGAAAVLVVLLLGRMVWDGSFVALPLDLPWSDEWTFLFGVTIIPMLAFAFEPTEDALRLMRSIGVWFGSLMILLVLVASVYALRNAKNVSRLSTDILNPISLAQAAISCLLVINARAIAGVTSVRRRPMLMLGRWLLTLICVLAAIATLSKGPLLALVAVGILAILFRGRIDGTNRGLATRLFALAFVAALGIGLVLLIDAYTPIQVVSRFTNAGGDASTSTRLDLIEGALTQFGESPWLGSAFVEYDSRFYPHNIIVEVMMTNGVLGLATLVLLLCGCFYSVGRILWSSPSERWIALLFVQYFIVSMFSGSLYFDSTAWASVMGLLGCTQAVLTRQKKQP